MRLFVFVGLFAVLVGGLWGVSLLLEPEGTTPPSADTGTQSVELWRGPPGKHPF